MMMTARRALTIVSLVLGGAAIIWWQSAHFAGGSTRMDLQISLTLGRQDLIVGESTSLSLTVTNVSGRRLTLPDPATHGELPKIRVRSVTANQEILTLGANERERAEVHEFVAPEPSRLIEMTPGQRAQRSADLLKWIGPLPPGRYELTALYDYESIQGASAPIPLSVEPLKLAASITVGSHSGDTPYRFCFWDARTARGSALLLTYFVFDSTGHCQVAQSERLADLDSAIVPAASVTQNQLSYPAQWVAWLGANGLTALYLKQGKIESPPRAHPLQNAAGARLIAPLLLDLAGSDGSRPGRGLVPLWRPGQLAFYVLEPDGSLSAGPTVALPAGELRWGRSIALANGERRFYLALASNNETSLETLKFGDRAPSHVDRFPGIAIGGGLSVSPQDVVSGAVVVRSGNKVSVHAWRTGAAEGPRSAAPYDLVIPGSLAFENALVAPGAGSKPSVFLQTADSRWFWVNSASVTNLIPQQLDQFGQPIDAFWLNGSSLQVLMAGEQTGLTYQPAR